jgi:hypothetical protein
MRARVCLAAMAMWLAGCHVDRAVPNAHLHCNHDSDCPGDLKCFPSPVGATLCCKSAESCVPPPDGGTGNGGTVGGGGGSGGSVGGGGVGGSSGSVPGDGGGASVDGPCAPQCSPGMIQCGSAGGRRCEMAADGCLIWGNASASIPCPGLQLIDDGIEERDVSAQCAGNLCLIGGITP